MHHMEIFLFICEQGTVSYLDIEREFTMSNAGVSRSVNALTIFPQHRQTALGLVEIFRNPAEGRSYLVRPSTKGKKLFKLVSEIN